MAASVIANALVEYDYPTPGQAPMSRRVDGAYGNNFEYQGGQHFNTLSDNIAASGSDVEGFLYVPDSVPKSTCDNATSQYIPSNVTRYSELPSSSDFASIAVGPWTTPSCVFEYLNFAQNNGAKAFYTFLPIDLKNNAPKDQSFADGAPPNATDAAWDLGDHGNWKTKYGFPVYAINSGDAQALLNLLSNYSGPIDTIPNGMQLSQIYPKGATIRVYSQASVPPGSTLPSLWVFLLIVLGILIAVLLIASIVMRVIQKRRRRELQRMITNGEVNLETLGVARIKVTEDILKKMPINIYVEHGGTPGPAHAPPTEATEEADAATATTGGKIRGMLAREKKAPVTSESTQLPAKLDEKVVMFPQETCPICIDDYENHVTPVRWLPCSHVFHPACIDPLMREYSSLCPICKGSVLPKDYIPEVTNVMVRRERLNRRFRDIERRETERAQAQPNMPAHFSGIGRFVRVGQTGNGEQTAREGQAPAINVQDVEMRNMQPAETSQQRPGAGPRNLSAVSASSAARRPDNVTREEWARQRAATLVGTSETVEEAEQREEARRPLWRRILGPVFPNLR